MTSARIASGQGGDATLFGVCHAIGQCCGIPPLLPRLGFIAAILADEAAVALPAYAIAAVMVAVARRTS